MKTVIVLPTGYGDCLMVTPAIEAYKAQTGAEITIACRPECFGLFKGNPSIDHLSCDAEVMFGDWDERLVMQGMIVDHPRGQTDSAYELACDLMNVPYPDSLAPRLYLTDGERAKAELIFGAGRPRIGFAPTASSLPRTLPSMTSKLITDGLREVWPEADITAFGESGYEGSVAGSRSINHVWFGALTLRRLIGAVAALDLLITVDSAPMHIAGAFRIPQVALFTVTPPVTRAKHFDNCITFMADEECAPCYAKGCKRIARMTALPGISPAAPCTTKFDAGRIVAACRELI